MHYKWPEAESARLVRLQEHFKDASCMASSALFRHVRAPSISPLALIFFLLKLEWNWIINFIDFNPEIERSSGTKSGGVGLTCLCIMSIRMMDSPRIPDRITDCSKLTCDFGLDESWILLWFDQVAPSPNSSSLAARGVRTHCTKMLYARQ